jgi:hypothetical protein
MSSRVARPWTDAEDRILRRDYPLCGRHTEIPGRTPAAVSHHARRLGLRCQSRGCRKSGLMSGLEVARHIGVHYSTMHKRALELGIVGSQCGTARLYHPSQVAQLTVAVLERLHCPRQPRRRSGGLETLERAAERGGGCQLSAEMVAELRAMIVARSKR